MGAPGRVIPLPFVGYRAAEAGVPERRQHLAHQVHQVQVRGALLPASLRQPRVTSATFATLALNEASFSLSSAMSRFNSAFFTRRAHAPSPAAAFTFAAAASLANFEARL